MSPSLPSLRFSGPGYITAGILPSAEDRVFPIPSFKEL